MKTLCGLLGIVWAALLIWLGYTAAPIWTPFLGAIVGVFLYVGYRPASRAAIAYDGIIRTSLTLYYDCVTNQTEAQHMRGFPAKIADSSISQKPRHYCVSEFCDAVVLPRTANNVVHSLWNWTRRCNLITMICSAPKCGEWGKVVVLVKWST
jgi:hypothetical protein